MKTVSSAMADHLASNVTTLCTCVKIIRQDNQAYYFTDHDVAVSCLGETYLPTYGFSRSSISSTVQLEIESADMQGIMLNSADSAAAFPFAIVQTDLDAGLYDRAVVYVYLANYNDPDMDPVMLRRGWIGEIESNQNGSYKAELRSMKQVLSTRVGHGYSPTCRADLGDDKCKVILTAAPWASNNGYMQGDRVLGVVSAANYFQNLTIVNGDFETQLTIDPGPSVPGWQTYGGSTSYWTRQSEFYSIAPHSGAYFVAFTNQAGYQATSGGMTQDVNLLNNDMLASDLDTGLCRLAAGVWIACSGTNTNSRFNVVAKDFNGNALQTIYDTGIRQTSSTKFVESSCDNVLIPTGTRTLTFGLWTSKKASNQQGAFFDSMFAAINLPQGTLRNFNQYGGVSFVAQNTGISGTTAPTWTNEIGATFVDGGITWLCSGALSVEANVTSVSSANAKAFYATSLTQEVGYFDGGVVTWETGQNAGRSYDVATWTGGLMTLLFRPFYQPSVGDRFVVSPGCDKTRGTCQLKFQNIINFRGEPDVPGQDRFFNVASEG